MHANPRGENRSKIHLLFLGLAGLTVLAFGLSFFLFHRLAGEHERGVRLDRELAERVAGFDRLETLVTDLNAPGGQFSLDGDVAKERARIAAAGVAIREEAERLQQTLRTDRSRENALRSLGRGVTRAAGAERAAQEVIEALSRHDLQTATKRVVRMDAEHLEALALLQEAEDQLRREEMLSLAGQREQFTLIALQERAIGIVLLVLTTAIVLYGRSLVKEMFTARDREAYVRQLQEREAALEGAIRERDEQTKRLEEAQSIAGLGSWEWDVAADRMRWSQELHRIFGTSPESDNCYASGLSRVHPDDRERIDAVMRIAIETGKSYAIEHRIIRTDGAIVILDSRGEVQCDASGKVIRIYGIAHDITARRRSEVELQRSEERFQLASRATNDGIWDSDLVKNTLWVNEGWARLFERPADREIDISTWKNAIHSEDRLRVLSSKQAKLASGENSWTEEYRIQVRGGRIRSVLDRCFVVRDAEGKAVRVIGAIMDITGRKEAEAAIAQLHRETALILETAADGLFGTDLAGMSTFVNPAAAHILGYEPQELLGKQIDEIIHPAHEDGTPYPWSDSVPYKAMREEGGRSGTGIFRSKSGRSIPVDYTATAMVDETGVITGCVVTFRDVSERQAVDRMKSEFVSTVSHELRTPLTSIRGALGLLATGRLGVLPEKGARLLEIASTNTDRLVRLINDILDIERMESGKVTLAEVPTNATDLVWQAVDITRHLAEEAGIIITIDSQAASLIADPDRIVQTLTNLIGNAIKFSPPHSTIHVSTETTRRAVIFRVADQGRGIPADKLESVFERFKQVDASDSRDKGGSGLGLAIVRSIVRQHGGEISVQSEVGVGSEFSFSIPSAQAFPAPFPRDAALPESKPLDRDDISDGASLARSPSGPRSRRMLIVEDDADLAKVIASSFERNGLEVIMVSTGREAIDLAGTLVPDLVVLDLLLPDIDGFGVIDWIKDHDLWRGVPLIVYSALETTPSQKERLRLGPTEFITKSRIRPQEFERRVLDLLDRLTVTTAPVLHESAGAWQPDAASAAIS
jgi:PAS domain S-box-containing protein